MSLCVVVVIVGDVCSLQYILGNGVTSLPEPCVCARLCISMCIVK